jgi:hypothetical protein
MESTADKFRSHLAGVKERKRKRNDIADNFEQLRKANILDADPAHVEACLCAKHGSVVVYRLRLLLSEIPAILKDRKVFEEAAFKSLGLKYFSEEQSVIIKALKDPDAGIIQSPPEKLVFLSHPTDTCVKCNKNLACHNKPSEVSVYGLKECGKAFNVCWRCEDCDINYNYCRFGNKKEGYRYYEETRPYIQASNCSFVERQLCLYQISLA